MIKLNKITFFEMLVFALLTIAVLLILTSPPLVHAASPNDPYSYIHFTVSKYSHDDNCFSCCKPNLLPANVKYVKVMVRNLNPQNPNFYELTTLYSLSTRVAGTWDGVSKRYGVPLRLCNYGDSCEVQVLEADSLKNWIPIRCIPSLHFKVTGP